MTRQENLARDLARRALELTPADEVEAIVSASDTALTRFANNHIHQNVAESSVSVSVRAVLGTRTGVASTSRMDNDGLLACGEAAIRAATAAPEDASFPGLPGPSAVTAGPSRNNVVGDFDAEHRALAARSIIDQSASRSLVAAGTVSASEHAIAIANSRGTDVTATATGVRATVLSMGDDGGSGWASHLGPDASGLASAALGDEAATLAERSANPGDLDPGKYTVVLAAEAVADILEFLGYVGFSARAVEEGRSLMSGTSGQQLMSESVTIADDALAAYTLGLPFDFEGVARSRVSLVDRGVIGMPVTDSYWAARTGARNTGHALPAPNPHGPMPMNLELAAGDATVDELVGAVKHGVYVTRFHYVNVEDPVPVTLTGMTRDGTFLIENGRLTRPLKNLRFTQSMVEALRGVDGATTERRLFGSELGGSYAPALLLKSFAFTGQTE